jgi:multiple sugar transport system substrate-binding protein
VTDSGKDRYGFSLRGGAGGGEHVIKMIRAFNGPLVDADGKPTLTKDAVATALEEYSVPYLVDKSAPPSAPNDGYNQIFQAFLTGRTGMLMHHTGSLKSVTSALKPGTEVMTAPMPKAKYETGWIQPLANGLMTVDGADNSLAWVEYWGSADPQVDFFKATGYFPVSAKAQTASVISADPLLKAALNQVKVGVTPEYFRGLQSWQDNSVLVQFQSVLVGKASISPSSRHNPRGLPVELLRTTFRQA